MDRRNRILAWLALGPAALGGAPGFAQSLKRVPAVSHVAPAKGAAAVPGATAALPTGTAEALAEMAAVASVVFAGHVEAVTRNDAAGFADVRFRIDQALRGCPKTGVYVLREWAGLWIGHSARYWVGERLLMLLPARGPSGMSAPVGGMDGAIPLVATGAEPLVGGTGVPPADDGSGADAGGSVGVDLRWVTARAVRGAVAISGPVASSGAQRAVVSNGAAGRPVLPTAGDPAAEGWSGPVAPLSPAGSAGGSAAGLRPSLSAVLTLLRGTTGAVGGVNDAAR